MKNLIITTLLITLLLGCTNQVNKVAEPQTGLNNDAGEIWEKIEKKTDWFKQGTKPYQTTDSLNPEFIDFYKQFISDKKYQLEHIEFPILGVIGECDSTILQNVSNWEFYNFDFRDNFYDSLDSNVVHQSNERFLFENYKKEVGLIFSIGFEKRVGKWYMTLYNLNTC